MAIVSFQTTRRTSAAPSSLPRHRRTEYGSAAQSYVVQVQLSDFQFDYKHSVSYETAEVRFGKFLDDELRLLSSPLWKWLGEHQPTSIRTVFDEFRVTDIPAGVRIAVSPAPALNAVLGGSLEREECGGWESDGWSQLDGDSASIDDASSLWDSIAQISVRCFTVDSLYGSHLPIRESDAWTTGHAILKSKREEAFQRRSRDESDTTRVAATTQDPLGREIEAAFHLRLIERRIECTVISVSEASRVH